ncbi:S-layer homology domain-containing protein [Paenibacillus sp. HN-1]|nr:S-layer homology domain-containing protein [Paenibacillus sinensis]MBY9079266.1 S-layer homology domain-containing protein [Paenibacillus sp. CGMCC 1.18879]MBY9086989.1 S-layer homology domain-containing protein [Paenibacillus sinensis]
MKMVYKKYRSAVKKAPLAILAITAALEAGGAPVYANEGQAGAKDYSGHWSETIIERSIGQKLLTGYQDGSFHPDSPITRAELAVLLTKAFPDEETKKAASFSDVRSGSWYASAISQAAGDGYLSADADGAFRPNQPATRAEAAAAFATALNWKEASADNLHAYKDIAYLPAGEVGQWLRQAAAQGYIEASSDGYLLPQKLLTRSEAVFFLAKANGAQPLDVQPPAFTAEQEHTGTIVQTSGGFGLKEKTANGSETVYSLTAAGDASLAGAAAVAGIESGTAVVDAVDGLVSGKLQVVKIAPGGSDSGNGNDSAAANLQELDGILIEGHHSGTSDPTKHSKKCLLMPGCASSGFGIDVLQTDGKYKYYKFDTRGHELAAVLIDSIKKETNIVIHVSGTIEGDIIHVASLSQDVTAVDAPADGDQDSSSGREHME